MPPLSGTRWVHLFEEDAGEGEVYGPDTDSVPLSRRPRRRLLLSPDGSARVTIGGPDDRPIDVAATWSREGDEIVVRTADQRLRVTQTSPTRLVVRPV